MNRIILCLPLLFFISCTTPESESIPDSGGIEPKAMPSGPYLGETAENTAKRFAPGFISTPENELNGLFSPDGKEFFYSIDAPRGEFAVILISRQDAEGNWSEPEIAPFSGHYSDVDPLMSPDGKRIFFCSKRPRPGNEEPRDADIWYVDRQGDGWSDPIHLDSTVNTTRNDWYCSSTHDGVLYYSTWDDERKTDDIFRVVPTENGYQREKIGEEVNTYNAEFDPFIAPDESYLIFSSWRQEGLGNVDLYISFQVDGNWTPAKNMGEIVNSPARDYCPWVSPDGQDLFFTSMRTETAYPGMENPTVDGLRNKIRSLDNGMGNVYWVKTDDIEAMRPPSTDEEN